VEKQSRNVLVLSGCQATLQTTGTTMIAVTGLAGFALATDKALATVPLTCYVLGSAITTIPASLLMKSIGRRGGFQVGTTIGMYGPSFLSGSLIHRFGVLNVILAGIVLLFVCIVSALAGTGLLNFWVALFLLGVGWNFMYVGGSALLTECHTPAERAKTQAANDFMIFVTIAISSTSSGVLLHQSGWHAVNYGSIPFLMLAATATLWLMWQRRVAGRPASQPVSE
jgi:MFS family permease